MVCDYNLAAQIAREREAKKLADLMAKKKAREDAIRKLESFLNSGKVTVGKTVTGEIGFLNWRKEDRLGFCDECAVSALKLKGSIAFTAALQKARIVSAVELAGGKH
jgi:hypothetical protein